MLCDQELPPKGLFTVTVDDCKGSRLIMDILRLRSESEVTYHLLMGDSKEVLKSNIMRFSAEASAMRFELSEMKDTVEFALINPSSWRRIRLRLTIFEGHLTQFLPFLRPDEILRFRRKNDTT